MQSRTYSTMLGTLYLLTVVGAAAFIIYCTALWVIDAKLPIGKFAFGIGLGVGAAALGFASPDKVFRTQMVRPLFVALAFEYLLAFGTLGLGYLSVSLQRMALWLHAPAGLLVAAVAPGGGRSTIRNDIGMIAVVEWLLIALVIYAFQWYSRRRHDSRTPPNQISEVSKQVEK